MIACAIGGVNTDVGGIGGGNTVVFAGVIYRGGGNAVQVLLHQVHRCYDMSMGATDKRYKWYEGVSIASIGGGAIGAQ